MKRIISILALSLVFMLGLMGCEQTAERKTSEAVNRQQEQYVAAQPIPTFDWSLERHLVIQLYQTRNSKVTTHTVWRSEYGMVEGDCPSMGFGIPYDTSLTNPLQIQRLETGSSANGVIEQAEPNGLFASKNTSATWVMCVGSGGTIEPVYVESKVTAYPYPVKVDYEKNRVVKAGNSSVSIDAGK